MPCLPWSLDILYAVFLLTAGFYMGFTTRIKFTQKGGTP